MKRGSIGFFAAISLQVLLLTSVIAFKQYTVWTGDTVILRVQPRDPRDLFRGDYVRLSFTISQLDLNELGGDDYFGYDDTAWVELARGDDGYWKAVAVWKERPSASAGHVLIKGTTRTFFRRDAQILSVEYGIEEVFVPEARGRDVESARDRVGLEVRVDRFGESVARRVLIDGKPLDAR